MSYVNIAKPKFFVDHINNRLATGTSQNNNADVISGTDLITSTANGTTEADLFDLKPSNQVEFVTKTNATTRTDHVLINYDTGGGFNTDFIAILNHNMSDSQARLRIGHSDTESHINTVDYATGFVEPVCTAVLNGAVSNDNVITPSANGSTLFTLASTAHRYIGIQFEGNNSGSFDTTNNLTVGAILIGEHYTPPAGPRVQLTRKIIFDGVNIQESIGGQRYATATHLGRYFTSSSNKSPFLTANQSYYVYGGRLSYDLEFTHLASSDVMPSDYSVETTASDSVVADVWNRTKGPMLPFIFSSDSTSTSASDFIYARFKQNSLVQKQIASNVFDIRMTIEEEF